MSLLIFLYNGHLAIFFANILTVAKLILTWMNKAYFVLYTSKPFLLVEQNDLGISNFLFSFMIYLRTTLMYSRIRRNKFHWRVLWVTGPKYCSIKLFLNNTSYQRNTYLNEKLFANKRKSYFPQTFIVEISSWYFWQNAAFPFMS